MLYEITQYEIHTSKYRVQADSEADAVVKVLDGEGHYVDDSLEYAEVAEDYGLPADEYPEIVDALREDGYGIDDIIPSIRSVEEIQ